MMEKDRKRSHEATKKSRKGEPPLLARREKRRKNEFNRAKLKGSARWKRWRYIRKPKGR